MGDIMKQSVNKAIQENFVMVFSKSYCPYCVKAKKLLQSLGIQYGLFELDWRDDGSPIQNYLGEITNQTTVPSIFINGRHIGGCDNLHSLYSSGKLNQLLSTGH